MTQPSALTPDSDPTLELAQRQLVLLEELAQMAMAAARAFTASAIASAKAEEMILAEEYFVPEVGRAKACGAKAAAESLTKVLRAARLTLMLQMNLAEIVRDIRAGQITYLGGIAFRKDAGGDARVPGESPVGLGNAGVPARPLPDDRENDRRTRDSNTEHLIDIERPDTMLRAPFRETVDDICGDLGATVDWTAWRLNPPEPTGEPPPKAGLDVKPPARSPPVPPRPPD